MRRSPLVLAWLVLGVVCFFSQSWAQCPEDPNDNGVCDTLYVEIWPGDDWPSGFPHFVRFPIRITNDIPDASIDSVTCFVIPLCFTSTNPSANAIIDPAKNKCGAEDLGRAFHPVPFNLNNSIFRDLPSMENPQELNWMMDLSDVPGWEWDTRILNLSTGSNFWLSLVGSGSQDQRFKGGSRVLLATATFTIEDTTTICIDSCHWPPTGRLAFSRSDAITYIPRHFLPVCEDISLYFPTLPEFVDGVDDQTHSINGYYTTDDFTVFDEYNTITSLWAEFSGEGVENISIYIFKSSTKDVVTGHVEYEVADHCEAGGTVTIIAINEWGAIGTDDFWIALTNAPPVMKLPDTLLVHAGNTALLETSALDANGDPVEIALDGFWYEPDSLQSPTNEPYYDGENPGLFSWLTAEADTGAWICLISATDICGAADVERIIIRVGVPFCGEANGDEILDLGDLVFLIGFLYKGGQPPDPLCKGDANCDGIVQISDVVALINYLFRSGPLPCFDCCPGGS